MGDRGQDKWGREDKTGGGGEGRLFLFKAKENITVRQHLALVSNEFCSAYSTHRLSPINKSNAKSWYTE